MINHLWHKWTKQKPLNPNQSGIFGRSKKCGRITPARFFELFHPHFSLKSTKQDFKWKLASLFINWVLEHHPRLYSFAINWHQSSLLWPWKFGSQLLKISQFLSYIDNMYIKWKLQTFYIQIWHKKV